MLSALFVSSLMATSVHSVLVLWVETVRDEKYLKREVIENLENLVE
jgi:heme exporter protein D